MLWFFQYTLLHSPSSLYFYKKSVSNTAAKLLISIYIFQHTPLQQIRLAARVHAWVCRHLGRWLRWRFFSSTVLVTRPTRQSSQVRLYTTGAVVACRCGGRGDNRWLVHHIFQEEDAADIGRRVWSLIIRVREATGKVLFIRRHVSGHLRVVRGRRRGRGD